MALADDLNLMMNEAGSWNPRSENPDLGHPAWWERKGLDIHFQVGDHVEEALVQPPICGDGILDGDIGDVQAVEHGDAAPLLVVDHVDGMQAVALAEDAVVGRGNAAALGVAQIDGAG